MPRERVEPASGDVVASVSARTARWGDTVGVYEAGSWLPHDGVVHILDIVAILHRFSSRPDAPSVERADLHREAPNGIIDILDAVSGVGAFRGRPYPFSPPCP